MEGAGKGNGGEVRRLHIIYFLSRMGRIEHPHLIRVHHLARNGVYLRDVKRWLADVRGKEMPDAFAWSYKRRYKSGYVWQDLLDDDLITPISDNEYVLKGSESIPSSPFDPRNDQPAVACEVDEQHQNQPSPKEEIQGHPEDPELDSPTYTSSGIYQELPLFGSESSTLTDDSVLIKLHEDEKIKQRDTSQNYSPSFYSSLMNKKKTKNKKTNYINDNNGDVEKMSKPGSLSFSSSKPKSYSNGASNMLRNLIKCGAVETNDAVLVSVNRADKTCSKMSTNTPRPDCSAAAICHVDKLGGSARIFGTPWNNQHQPQYTYRKSFDGVRSSKKKHNEFASPKRVSDAYKPVGGPTCSQCGKSFKPEKFHTHMKSCKGMKALAKTNAVSVERTPSRRSVNVNLSHEESTSGLLLSKAEF